MLALPIIIVFALCAILAAATGAAIPPFGYLSFGVFCLIVIAGSIYPNRRRSAQIGQIDRQVDLAAWFATQLGEPVQAYAIASSAAMALPTEIDHGELFTEHGIFNAPLMAGARRLTNRISRAIHVKGAPGTLGQGIGVDDGVVYLVLSEFRLTVWQASAVYLNRARPVYLRGYAHGSELARITTRTFPEAISGRFLLRLRFADGSRHDYLAYGPKRAAAFRHQVGAIQRY